MAPRTAASLAQPSPPPAPLPVVDFGSSLNLAHLAQSSQLPPLPTTTATTSRTRQLASTSTSAPPPPPALGPRTPDLQHVARTVLKAKRIAVVCGPSLSLAHLARPAP